jgi:hypothetical protein
MAFLGTLVERDSVLLHLGLQFVHRNGTISIFVHLLKKKLNFFFGYLGVNMLEEFRELFIVEFLQFFETQPFDQSADIDVFGVYLETQFAHDAFELIFKQFIFEGVLLEFALEDGMHEHLVP